MGTQMKRVVGLSQARAMLQKLPDRVQKRVITAATRSAATVLLRAVKAAAPVGSEPSPASAKYGSLKENLRVIRLKRDVPKGSAMYRVDSGNAFWGYMIEYGTGMYYSGPGSYSKGDAAKSHMRAKAWFRPAVDIASDKALNAMKESLARGVAREAEKLAKGGK